MRKTKVIETEVSEEFWNRLECLIDDINNKEYLTEQRLNELIDRNTLLKGVTVKRTLCYHRIRKVDVKEIERFTE